MIFIIKFLYAFLLMLILMLIKIVLLLPVIILTFNFEDIHKSIIDSNMKLLEDLNLFE